MYEEGDYVKVASDNDNENYDEFRDKIFIITNIATNESEHPGFDAGLCGQGLYDLETLDGESVGCSLYDYELEKSSKTFYKMVSENDPNVEDYLDAETYKQALEEALENLGYNIIEIEENNIGD